MSANSTGGTRTRWEVHDLDNEKTAGNQCQIDEIIRGRQRQAVHHPLGGAQRGYDNCAYALGNSTR